MASCSAGWYASHPFLLEPPHTHHVGKNPPFEVGDSKRKPKKIVFQESFFRGWAVGFCWCFFYLKNFPQIRCFGWFDGISTQIDKDLQEDWSSIWMNYSSHIHPAFTISYMNLMYTFTFFSETICWDVLGSLLFTQKHLVGYLKVSLTQKNCLLHLGAIFFCHHCFRQDPAGKSIMRSWMLSSHPFMWGMLWEGMLCAGVEGVNAWVVFLGRSRTTGDPHFIKLGMNTATLALWKVGSTNSNFGVPKNYPYTQVN